MLTQEQLKQLQNDCTFSVSDLDGRVSLEQDDNGKLTFILWNEDEESESVLYAEPHGTTREGRPLYLFTTEGGGPDPVGTLTPAMICGLLR